MKKLTWIFLGFGFFLCFVAVLQGQTATRDSQENEAAVRPYDPLLDGPKRGRKERWPILPAAKTMVEDVLRPQGTLKNERVLSAMMRIPREKFVPPVHRSMSYEDIALPIGNAQTISPPYIVAYMTEMLDPQATDTVLEIGTGSGYQAAVLSLLVQDVYSIEIVEPLGKRASKTLKKLGFKNVHTWIGDGYQGWPEAAPFDKIIVTCSPESVPQPLIDQLKEGGRMIVPVGERYQQTFYLFKKTDGKLEEERLSPALFVPMTGEAEEQRAVRPDPENPEIIGGDFEETSETGLPLGWHYSRNATIREESDAPSGKKYIRFEIKPDSKAAVSDNRNVFEGGGFSATPNSGTGKKIDADSSNLQAAQLIQGFAVDGKNVTHLKITAEIRGENIALMYPNQRNPRGTIVLIFYDEDRETLQQIELAQAWGTFDWHSFSTEITVPKAAREAILFIGLFQMTGQLDMDAVFVQRSEK